MLLVPLLNLEWNVTDHLYIKIKVCFTYEVSHKYYIAQFIAIFVKSTWFISGDNNILMYIFLLVDTSFSPEDTGLESNFSKWSIYSLPTCHLTLLASSAKKISEDVVPLITITTRRCPAQLHIKIMWLWVGGKVVLHPCTPPPFVVKWVGEP